MWRRITLVVILTISIVSLSGKERTGWGFGGVPALNYNADEGFGYGVVAEFYNYSTGGYSPYYYSIQPTIFFTTGGKQAHTIFFDTPYMLGKGYRLNAELRYNKEEFNPYYGIGNNTIFDEKIIDEEDTLNYINKHFYTHQRERVSFKINLQKAFTTHPDGKPLFSMLIGLGIIRTTNQLESDSSKLLQDLKAGIVTQKEIDGGFTNYLKLGLIHDTRDNEPAPNRGHWTDLVGEIYTGILGSDYNFSRWTFTDRRYFSITKNLVFAERIVFEKIFGDVPFYELAPYGSSFKINEGLGGSKSLRGVLKNRFMGPTKLIANLEMRYKFYQFSAFNQDFYLAVNPFLDLGRVWAEDDDSGLKDLHAGYGMGLHIAWNENFIVAIDMGTSDETTLQLYIDLGYLF